MSNSIPPWRIPVIGIGLSCLVIDQVMNVQFMVEAEKAVTALVIAVPISGIVAAACFPVMGIAWQNRQMFNWLLLAIVFVCFATFSLGASLDRAGSSLDNKVAEAKTKNVPAQLAKSSHARALEALQEARTRATDECATGRGRKCSDRETEVSQARKKVAEAEAALVSAGVAKSVNPMASRIASIIGVNENTVNTYYPLFLPIGLWLGGIVFIGVGFGPSRQKTVKEEKEKIEDLPLNLQIQLWIEEQKAEGRKATQRAAAEHFGISPSSVNRHLRVVK